MQTTLRSIGFAASAALLVVIPTGADASTPTMKPKNLDVINSSEGSSEDSSELTAEVNKAEKSDTGNLVSITWSIENEGNSKSTLTWLYDRSYAYSGSYFSGVTLTDSSASSRYHPIMDGFGQCLCSGNISNDFTLGVNPKEKNTYWSLFSVPEDVDTVTVEIPGFEPIEDIPIS